MNIRRQCREQKVPFFFKQWGGVRKHVTGRTLNSRTYDKFPPPLRGRSRLKGSVPEGTHGGATVGWPSGLRDGHSRRGHALLHHLAVQPRQQKEE